MLVKQFGFDEMKEKDKFISKYISSIKNCYSYHMTTVVKGTNF